MIIHRRDMLKGLALTGASGAVPGAMTGWISDAGKRVKSAGSSAGKINIMACVSSQSQAFVDGASRSARRLGAEVSAVLLSGSLFDDLPQVERLLQSREPLIALLGTADGILLTDLARSSGMRFSFLGQHNVGGPDWSQHHDLTTMAQSAGVGSALLAALGRESYVVIESPLDGDSGAHLSMPGFEAYQVSASKTLTMHLAEVSIAEGCAALGISGGSVTHLAACSGTAPNSNRPWAALLGDSLMQVACGSWLPTASGSQAFLSRGDRGKGMPESLTSILIQG